MAAPDAQENNTSKDASNSTAVTATDHVDAAMDVQKDKTENGDVSCLRTTAPLLLQDYYKGLCV